MLQSLERLDFAPIQCLQGQGNTGQKGKSWSARRWNPCFLCKFRV